MLGTRFTGTYRKSVSEVVKLFNQNLLQQFRVGYHIHWFVPHIVATMNQKAVVTVYGDHSSQ